MGDLVHFACHGGIDPDHPDQSGLRLDGGTLTISALSRVRGRHALQWAPYLHSGP